MIRSPTTVASALPGGALVLGRPDKRHPCDIRHVDGFCFARSNRSDVGGGCSRPCYSATARSGIRMVGAASATAAVATIDRRFAELRLANSGKFDCERPVSDSRPDFELLLTEWQNRRRGTLSLNTACGLNIMFTEREENRSRDAMPLISASRPDAVAAGETSAAVVGGREPAAPVTGIASTPVPAMNVPSFVTAGPIPPVVAPVPPAPSVPVTADFYHACCGAHARGAPCPRHRLPLQLLCPLRLLLSLHLCPRGVLPSLRPCQRHFPLSRPKHPRHLPRAACQARVRDHGYAYLLPYLFTQLQTLLQYCYATPTKANVCATSWRPRPM